MNTGSWSSACSRPDHFSSLCSLFYPQVIAFDEASKDAFSEAAFEFRMLFLHYASLMNAMALIDLRQVSSDAHFPNVERSFARARRPACPSISPNGSSPQDDKVDYKMAINQEDPFLFKPNATVARVPVGGEGNTKKIAEGAECAAARFEKCRWTK
jgi:hypothetical protein